MRRRHTGLWVGLLVVSLTTTTLTAQSTDYVGGTSSAGTRDFSLSCASGSFITDVQMTYADVIDRIRIRCRPRTADGKWGSTSTWSSWTISDNPYHSNNPSATVSCSQDQFVAGFNAYTKNIATGALVLSRISISCHASTANGEKIGSAQTNAGGGSSSGGSWSGTKTCPSNGFARGTNGRSGWHIDRMRFNCTDPVAVPAPTAAPVMASPLWSGDASANTAAAGNWAVTFSAVANATRYKICLRRYGSTTGCYSEQTYNASSAYSAGGKLQFPVTIPAGEQGFINDVAARGCNDAGTCGPWSTTERMTVVPNAPALSSPSNNASASSRSVTFSWQANSAANAGYQLFLTAGSGSYDVYNPTAPSVSGKFHNVQLGSGTTSHTIQIPNEMGTSVRWAVAGCANFTGKGRRCSLGFNPRSLTLPAAVSTGTALEWKWTTRLTAAHFQALNISLNNDLSNKLVNYTYTIGGIINSNTDRLVDTNRCSTCHTGQATQSAATYRPTLPVTQSNEHRKNKGDASTTSTYRWNNTGSRTASGIVQAFVASSANKPQLLEALFQKWLSEGAQ